MCLPALKQPGPLCHNIVFGCSKKSKTSKHEIRLRIDICENGMMAFSNTWSLVKNLPIRVTYPVPTSRNILIIFREYTLYLAASRQTLASTRISSCHSLNFIFWVSILIIWPEIITITRLPDWKVLNAHRGNLANELHFSLKYCGFIA